MLFIPDILLNYKCNFTEVTAIQVALDICISIGKVGYKSNKNFRFAHTQKSLFCKLLCNTVKYVTISGKNFIFKKEKKTRTKSCKLLASCKSLHESGHIACG